MPLPSSVSNPYENTLKVYLFCMFQPSHIMKGDMLLMHFALIFKLQQIFFACRKEKVNWRKNIQVWQGGLSFHGGFLGVIIAGLLFCKRYAIDPWQLGDVMAYSATFGIFYST